MALQCHPEACVDFAQLGDVPVRWAGRGKSRVLQGVAPAPDPGPGGQKGPFRCDTQFHEEMTSSGITLDSKPKFGGVGWLSF